MNHVDKYGNAKIVSECTLPLTSKMCGFNYYGYGSNGSNAGWTYFTRIDEPIHSRRYKKHTEADFKIGSNLLVIE